ncbi:hypothetical protein N7519_005659 [Penicillium mononematosum]|uniref:uncharacterized protein n=1 Tax=Penicillium mononematosum TaxID=268346 RepID=UPI002546C778|nr:uncharacterized protein N7519_005659 [Penicillium mononematosum]KAJ6184358.1 hypothetical protein N7519_005659 [Penicillium mononematosum]
MELFPTTQEVEFDDRIFIFRVQALPPKPWPKRVAGVPCYLTEDPYDDGPAIPYEYRSRSRIDLSKHLDLRDKNGSLDAISDMVRHFFQQAGIPITEIQVWSRIVVIVLEQRIDHDEKVMDDILKSIPHASISQPDRSEYDTLRPGVMISSGTNSNGEPMRSSSGILVRDHLGSEFMTVATHRFPFGENVHHPHAGGRVVGKLLRKLPHTDVALVKLEEGEEFVNEPFENTLTPSSTFRLQNFVRIGETRKYDQVFFDSPFSGLAEGQRMSENLMRVPADNPEEPH